MMFDAAQIALATGGTAHGGDHRGPLATDSRTMPEDGWFVALVGPNFDGHDYAVASGAKAGVFQRAPQGWSGPWVEVADTTRALQDLGRAARARIEGPVVGVTGSSGKTTTRALIVCALHQMGRVHHTAANLNNHLGVPLTLVGCDEDADAAVVEMGTSAPGEIAVLADIGNPDVRVIVNVGPAHLEELGGLAGVAKEKGALFDGARPDDVCIINGDDPFLRDRSVPGRRVVWGRAPDADVRLLDVVIDPTAWTTTGTYATPQGSVRAVVPAPGEHIAHNAGAALAVAFALGLDLKQAAADLASYAPVGMRLKPTTLPGGALALNDAYNANPASMRASLQTLRALGRPAIAVLGDMLELGTEEASLHRALLEDVDAMGFKAVMVVGPRMHSAADALVRTVCLRCETPEAGARALVEHLHPDDVVLFKGSRGARVERVLDATHQALESSP